MEPIKNALSLLTYEKKKKNIKTKTKSCPRKTALTTRKKEKSYTVIQHLNTLKNKEQKG